MRADVGGKRLIHLGGRHFVQSCESPPYKQEVACSNHALPTIYKQRFPEPHRDRLLIAWEISGMATARPGRDALQRRWISSALATMKNSGDLPSGFSPGNRLQLAGIQFLDPVRDLPAPGFFCGRTVSFKLLSGEPASAARASGGRASVLLRSSETPSFMGLFYFR